LHQDVKLIHGDNFIEGCIDALSPQDRVELRTYVEWLLKSKSNAELKGLLRRSVVDLLFTSKSARAVFDAMAASLRT
jgi:hypothetical protein